LSNAVKNGQSPWKIKGFDQSVNFFASPLTR